jgi:FkbM family methyltransferase
MTTKALALKYLPAPAIRHLRGVKSYLATCLFRPYEARHKYAGFDLSVHIADRTGRLWYDHDWEELPEHTLLRTHKLKLGAKVFELGAHQAVVALMVSRMVGENGSVIALEPGRHNFETALKNKRANAAHNLTMLCAAATDCSGEISFSDTMNGRIGPGFVRPAYSVDDLATKFGAPDVVKIDVEGYESKVLQGAVATLAAKPDWYVEVHSGLGLEDNGGSPERIVELFRDAGYQLYIQDDIQYRSPFRPLDVIPHRWFQLVATAS